jgi:DNA repair exonuclease SbcCD ATPase subunit
VMTGVGEFVAILKLPAAGISSLHAVARAIKDGAAHVKAKKEYEAAIPLLVALLEQIQSLAVAQVKASSIITEFEFFPYGQQIACATPTDLANKLDRFNGEWAAQKGRAAKLNRELKRTRMRSGEVWQLAQDLDRLARRHHLKNLFGLLKARANRLEELRRQLARAAEDDHEVIQQYEHMAKAVRKTLNEVKRALDRPATAAEKLTIASALLAARADEFRPVRGEAIETLEVIEAALVTLVAPTPDGASERQHAD